MEHTTYGYFSDGVGPLASAKEGTVTITPNNQMVPTLLGQNTIARGTVQVKYSTKHAVPKGQTEQKRLLRAIFSQEEVTMTYAVGEVQMTAFGKLSSATLTSGVNAANGFDLEFDGYPTNPTGIQTQ